MKIRMLVWCLVLGAVVTLSALSYQTDELIQVSTSAIGFTANKINPVGSGIQATMAVCRLEQAEIRYRVGGIGLVPTSGGSGTLMEIGDVIAFQGNDVLRSFFAIRTGSTNGILNCTYTAP